MRIWMKERVQMGALRLALAWRRLVRRWVARPRREGCYALDEATDVPVGEWVTVGRSPATPTPAAGSPG